jgi:flagellar biosynthesis protein FlhG
MIDAQADRLRARAAAAGIGPTRADAARTAARVPDPASVLPGSLARTVAVASGKGGVGKSTLALGIAMAAAERGVRTAIVDADLGLANLDLLAGVRPARTAADWMAGRARLSECFVTLAPRLWLLPGASGVARMADLSPAQRARFLEGIARVSAHVQLVVLDLGAGIGPGTLDVAAAADRLLLVATPEPTALTDAYAFAKACALAGRRGGWSCVTSMSRDAEDGRAAAGRLQSAARAHLGIEVESLGFVRDDEAVRDAVRARRPLLALRPRSAAAADIRRVEARIAGVADGAGTGNFVGNLAARLGMRMVRPAAAAAVAVAALGGTVTR